MHSPASRHKPHHLPYTPPAKVHEYSVDLRGGGAPPTAAPADPLRRLRTSSDLAAAGPVTHVTCHPDGRHLVTVSGAGDVAAVDLKLMIRARWFGRVNVGVGPPLKAAVSPGA
jgi:hypothetical protein